MAAGPLCVWCGSVQHNEGALCGSRSPWSTRMVGLFNCVNCGTNSKVTNLLLARTVCIFSPLLLHVVLLLRHHQQLSNRQAQLPP